MPDLFLYRFDRRKLHFFGVAERKGYDFCLGIRRDGKNICIFKDKEQVYEVAHFEFELMMMVVVVVHDYVI